MEVHHNHEADTDGDEAVEFDLVIAIDAAGDVVGDLFVENDHGRAGAGDEEAEQEPAETELPIYHNIIIAQKIPRKQDARGIGGLSRTG